jgi:L,D-transpeptidase catalytic domain
MCPWFKRSVWAISLLAPLTAPPAFSAVLISVDKGAQQMSVSVDGAPRYRFAVSTGRAGYGTPNGTYHPQRLSRAVPSRRESLSITEVRPLPMTNATGVIMHG